MSLLSPAFSKALREYARKTLASYEIQDVGAGRLLDDGPDVFGKTTDRSELGSMPASGHCQGSDQGHFPAQPHL